MKTLEDCSSYLDTLGKRLEPQFREVEEAGQFIIKNTTLTVSLIGNDFFQSVIGHVRWMRKNMEIFYATANVCKRTDLDEKEVSDLIDYVKVMEERSYDILKNNNEFLDLIRGLRMKFNFNNN